MLMVTLDQQPLSAYCIDVIQAFRALQTAMEALHTQLVHRDAALPVWFEPPPQLPLPPDVSEREKVFIYLTQFEYLSQQLPREILVGPGILGASQATLGSLAQVNTCKQHFKKSVLALKMANASLLQAAPLNQAFEDLLNKRHHTTATQLKKMGLARLHLKQCYRLIPCFQQKPERIAWTWANTRSIKRISVTEADGLLCKQGRDGGIDWQRQKLAQLSPKEPLAIVQELAPHLRANLVFKTAQGTHQRKMVKGPVPFFYLVEDEHDCSLPYFRAPGSKKSKDKERPIRRDVKLDPTVFLPAIRAHRYVVDTGQLETN